MIVNSAVATASAIEIESGAGLAVSAGNALTVGPSGGPNASAIHGDVTLNAGTLAFKTMNVTYDSGSVTLVNGGVLDLDASTSFSITNSRDVTDLGGGANQILNAGAFSTSAGAGNPVMIGPPVVNSGSVANQSGTLRLLGGASGTGSWSPGSDGSTLEARLELYGPSTYTFDGPVSDGAAGGVGHLLVSGTTLFMATPASTIDVYEVTVDALAGGLDFTGTSMSADYFTLKAGTVDASAVQPSQFGNLTIRDGEMVGIGEWSAGFFHWGGGLIESGGSQALTVGTLDMTVGAGDSGTRAANQRDLIVTGASTQDYPYAAGTLDLRGNSDMTIGNGVRFVMRNDVDIDRTTGTGTIVVHGTLDKDLGAGTSAVAPAVSNPDGVVKVSQGTLDLAVAPLQYDGAGDALTAGTWVVVGTLRFPGPLASLASGVQFLGGHLVDSLSGFDALTTITSNAAGNVLTLGSGSQVAPPPGADFTNDGTINLSGSSAVNVSGGGDYIQAAPGAATNLTSTDSDLTAAGGGLVRIHAGTLSGVGTITGGVTNPGGSVAPGNSPGTLTINGDYAQSATGVLVQEIAGIDPSQYDRLVVSGQANLGGTMVLQSSGGYTPTGGQAFDVLTAGTRVGTFANVVQFPVAPYMDVRYDGGGGPGLRLVANSVSAADVTVTEGGSGTVGAAFTVSLAAAAPEAVSVDWATQDGTATAGSDYVAANGTVSFAPGEISKTVSVVVNGDAVAEGDENFAINLSNPVGTRIADGQGVGTIATDDARPAAVVAQVPPDDIDGFVVPPPPVQGKAVNVEPRSGTVLVKLPRSTRFVRLPDAEQVPVGTIVDARKGTVRLYSVGSGGRVQFADLWDGVFQVLQKPGQALTELRLTGGSFTRACGRTGVARAAATRRSKSVRRLWGSGTGKFRTRGRFATATLRGTKWLTDDRCDGTLIRVTVGAVTVRDLTRKRSVVVKRPKSYLAPATKPRRRR